MLWLGPLVAKNKGISIAKNGVRKQRLLKSHMNEYNVQKERPSQGTHSPMAIFLKKDSGLWETENLGSQTAPQEGVW